MRIQNLVLESFVVNVLDKMRTREITIQPSKQLMIPQINPNICCNSCIQSCAKCGHECEECCDGSHAMSCNCCKENCCSCDGNCCGCYCEKCVFMNELKYPWCMKCCCFNIFYNCVFINMKERKMQRVECCCVTCYDTQAIIKKRKEYVQL